MPVTAAAQSASGPQPPTPPAALAAFDALVPGDQAPGWLRDGVTASWQFGPDLGGEVAMRLITISENATFLVTADGEPAAVVRVARPGYLAGADAFESEVAWVAALAADGVCQVPAALRTRSGTFCAALASDDGTDWWCVAYGYVAGRILEDLFSEAEAGSDAAADPTSYYREIGAINARLHEHALTWEPPAGFARHSWDVPVSVISIEVGAAASVWASVRSRSSAGPGSDGTTAGAVAARAASGLARSIAIASVGAATR